MSTPRPDQQNPMGFIVGGEFKNALNRLSIFQKGLVFDALLRDLDEEPLSPEMDDMSLLMFDAIIPSVHRLQGKKAQSAAASRDNGARGGRPRKEKPEGSEGNLQVPEETCRFPEKPAGFDGNLERHSTQLNSTEQNSTRQISPLNPPQGGGSERPKKPPLNMRESDFEEWYRAYPKHEKRAEAKRAWEKAVKDGSLPVLPVLLEALSWQRRKEQWQDYKYIPLPASYLNAQAWLDERPKAGRAPIVSRHAPSQEEMAARRTMQNGLEVIAEMEDERRRREEEKQ